MSARDELSRIVRYVGVGGSTALLELGLFQLMRVVIGLGVLPANAIATIIATCTNFCLNRSVTFQSTSNPTRAALLYTCLFFINMLISTAGIYFFESLGLPSAGAKLIMQACVTCWNFILYRKVVFV